MRQDLFSAGEAFEYARECVKETNAVHYIARVGPIWHVFNAKEWRVVRRESDGGYGSPVHEVYRVHPAAGAKVYPPFVSRRSA